MISAGLLSLAAILLPLPLSPPLQNHTRIYSVCQPASAQKEEIRRKAAAAATLDSIVLGFLPSLWLQTYLLVALPAVGFTWLARRARSRCAQAAGCACANCLPPSGKRLTLAAARGKRVARASR